MPYTVASPRPVPFPTAFVVKKGSNRWACTSASMPTPVSVTASITYRPGLAPGWSRAKVSSRPASAVSSVSWPPAGIASRAFTYTSSRKVSRTGPTSIASLVFNGALVVT